MKQDRKELLSILAALALLSLVSLYRQLSLRFLPDDGARPFVVYAAYLFLLVFWMRSLHARITQRSMRIFLLSEGVVMLFWLTIRFAQDAFLYQNVAQMRFFGYFINVPAAAIPLLGLYAAFGLGRGDDYRFSGKWYLLSIPAAALIAMALTDEYHHFLCYVVPGEPQPNLYFHPYVGTYMIYLWVLVLVAARVAVIYRRNSTVRNKSALQKTAPFFEILLLLAFCTPYTVSSFWVSSELIEFSAGVFFIEAVSWELFICTGLIPVNTQYAEVFDRSTVAMQLLSDDGAAFVRSAAAPLVSAGTFALLRKNSVVSRPDGKELRLYPLKSGYLVWQRDVSQLRSVIDQLRKSSAELRQESDLLGQELRLKSEEAAVAEQNRIYNRLTGEVGQQLSLINSLVKKTGDSGDGDALFRRICLLGVYVKRRCNLRLIEQSDGAVPRDDILLSFRDLDDCLSEMGVSADVSWLSPSSPSPRFALLSLDMFEFLLEYERFALTGVSSVFAEDGSFSVSVVSDSARAGSVPARELAHMGRDGLSVSCEAAPGGYAAVLREGGGAPC